MAGQPVMTAIDRFKRRLADAIERICVLEAELEKAQAEVERLGDELERAKAD